MKILYRLSEEPGAQVYLYSGSMKSWKDKLQHLDGVTAWAREQDRIWFAVERSDPEITLRALWDGQGVSKERQDAIIAEVTAKAQPGAMVGPFVIGA